MFKHHEQHEPIVIPMEDPLIHTADHPFCSDPICPCHRDSLLLAEVYQKVEQGLLTPDEATRVVRGQQV